MSLMEIASGRMRIGFDAKVAAGAAIATAAAVYLMPVDLLQNAVLASGLPSVLPPLDPPLGNKARLGLALVAAGLAFGIVALLTRLVIGRGKGSPPVKAAADPKAPRLRRRDRHPDAPARAPLSIGREIAELEEEAAPARPLPGFAKRNQSAHDLPWADPVEPFTAPIPAQSAFEPESVEDALPPLELGSFEAAPEAVTPPEAVVWDEAPETVSIHPAWIDVAQPQPAPAREASLAELLERLERAMGQRMVPAVAASAPIPAAIASEAASADDADVRLRSALENLKRFAPRRG